MILLIFQVYFSPWSKHTLHANELRRIRTDLFAESEHELQIGMHIVSKICQNYNIKISSNKIKSNGVRWKWIWHEKYNCKR